MRKLFALICIIGLSTGCGDKAPADVLPEEKFQEVMWDMLKVGEFLDGYVLYKDSVLDKSGTITAWYNKVYTLHNITKDQFEKSYAYYQDKPAIMKVMLDSLSKRQLAAKDTPSDTTSIKVPIDTPAAIKPVTAPGQVTPPTTQVIPVPTTPSNNLPSLKPDGRERKQRMIDSLRRTRQLKVKELRNQ